MPVEILMPKLGLTMAEGLILEWKKKEGDQVKKGEVLFILETEKVTYEVEADDDGTLGKILFQEKETVPVGALVGYILKPGENISDLEGMVPTTKLPPVAGQEAGDGPRVLEDATPVMQFDAGGRIKASPLAKKTARLRNVDLRAVRGTGPQGMVILEDVEKAIDIREKEVSAGPSGTGRVLGQKLVPFTGMRRAIARKMMGSKTETAQTYMSNTVDAGRITEYRRKVLPRIQEAFGVRVTITDMLMKVTAAAIREHPVINTQWTDEGIQYLEDVHMGMAMALGEGLIVAVIRDIDRKSLAQVAKDRLELVQKGKDNRFLPDDISGSTFTLSALGMFGVEQFTANINLPENAILAVGAIIDKPVAIDGQVAIRPMMHVTLSYDHRTIDGAEAAKFMRTLKSFIEDPVAILEDSEGVRDQQTERVTVIGGGVGGYPAAITAARMGAEVVLIEKDSLGGVCLNWGCIPTKSMLQSCQVVKTIEDSEVFGIHCEDYKFDLSAIMRRKNRVVEQLRNGVEKLLAARKIRVIKGTATLLDSSTVQILETQEKIASDKIIIASGSVPQTLNIEGAEASDGWDSNDFLEMQELPKSAVIIGGGVIGVEFAQILNGFGVDVTILEIMDSLIPGMDREIALALQDYMVGEGIKVFTGAEVKKITHVQGKNRVAFTFEEKQNSCFAEKVLFSVGRTPNLAWLDLDRIGLAKKNGALLVNERMETNVPGIYAVGDVTGGIMLAHVAIAEGECAAKNAMGRNTAISYGAVPSCVYTSPEVASVGLSEEQARENFDIQVGRFSFHASAKALILNDTYGMVKIVSEKRSGTLLGVHIIGPQATDLIGEAVLALSMKMTVNELARAMHPHPSLSEAIMESASALCGGAIHMP